MSNFAYGLTGDTRTWTDETGGVWSNVLTAAITVITDDLQKDDNGDVLRLTPVTSLAEVQATSNSYWKDGSNKLYIHTFDDATPDRTTMLLSIARMNLSSGHTNYLENIRIINGLRLSNNTTPRNYFNAKNCQFAFAESTEGFLAQGNITLFLDSCGFIYNYEDGIDYSAVSGYNAHSIEYNCYGYYSGATLTSGINNISTGHDDSRIIRVNGMYSYSEGPVVHDVNTSQSWNVDCIAYNSNSSVAANKSAFACGTGADTSKMWLDGCATKNDGTFGAEVRSGSMYIRNSRILNIESGSVLIDY